jgi:glutathione S-transferase
VTGAKIVLYDYLGSICSQMARLALLEKGVPFERRNIDIMKKAEQFEPWYTALNPKAVVPTLAIGDEIVTDTVRIVYRSTVISTALASRPSSPSAPKRWSA